MVNDLSLIDHYFKLIMNIKKKGKLKKYIFRTEPLKHLKLKDDGSGILMITFREPYDLKKKCKKQK